MRQSMILTVLFTLTLSPTFAAEMPRLFPEGAPPVEMLEWVDFSAASSDLKLAATTLQGLANRERGRVLLSLLPKEVDSNPFWIAELVQKGSIKNSINIDQQTYFQHYLPYAKKRIVYDPDLPASINVASMLAGVEAGMVCSPDLLERFPIATENMIDLRGKWTSNVDAYRWAFTELFPKMNQRLLATYHPTRCDHHLRDYLVRNNIFTFWVTGKKHDQAAYADHVAEKTFVKELFAATPPNIPVFGWWDAGEKDQGLTEYGGVNLAGQYGKLTFAMDWQENLSIYSGIPVDRDALAERFKTREVDQKLPALEKDKVYICFAIMDAGDAPAYWQHLQHKIWQDPKRGDFPIAWTLAPAAVELTPAVMEWFLEAATPQDHFIMALSGMGYVQPYRDLMSKTASPETAWREFLRGTDQYMDAYGMNTLAVYTDAFRPFLREKKDAITQRFTQSIPSLDLLLLGMGRDENITTTSPHYVMDDTLVTHIFTRWDAHNIGRNEKNTQWLVEEIKAQTPKQRPAFMMVYPLTWSYYPSDLAAVTEKLGETYVPVSPNAFKTLWETTQK